MKKFLFLLLVITMLVLAACSTWNKFDQKERGAVIGGGTGAVVGSATSGGSAGGALLGGAVGAVGGGLIGNEMDQKDRR